MFPRVVGRTCTIPSQLGQLQNHTQHSIVSLSTKLEHLCTTLVVMCLGEVRQQFNTTVWTERRQVVVWRVRERARISWSQSSERIVKSSSVGNNRKIRLACLVSVLCKMACMCTPIASVRSRTLLRASTLSLDVTKRCSCTELAFCGLGIGVPYR